MSKVRSIPFDLRLRCHVSIGSLVSHVRQRVILASTANIRAASDVAYQEPESSNFTTNERGVAFYRHVRQRCNIPFWSAVAAAAAATARTGISVRGLHVSNIGFLVFENRYNAL